MTTLLERFTGADADREETPLTQPYHRRPAGLPFWAGVPGLDPAAPLLGDWSVAARLAAMVCALHVHGPDAGLPRILGKPPAQKYLDWLLEARSEDEAYMRRYALRFACEHADIIGAGGILDVASQVCAAVAPGRRR
jgi:hypothetical protein